MNTRYSYYRLHAKIDEMSKYINLKKFMEGEKNSLDQIRSYFKINHWAYRHYHSKDGFMHFRISKNGCFSDEDIYHQPDSISEFIKDGDTVIELGCGTSRTIAVFHRSQTSRSMSSMPSKHSSIVAIRKKFSVRSGV